MEAQKKLSPEEKAAAMPVVQGVLHAYEQHYGLNLIDWEISRVVGMAIDNLKSTSTSEVHGAVKDQLFAFLMEKDPARAIDFRMKAQNVPESERGRIHNIAEEKGFKAANAELAKLTKPPVEKPPEAAPAQSPMFLDPQHDQEIKRTLDKAATSDFGTPFDQCTPMQKAETLKTVLEAGGTLGLTYDRRMGQKPQTVKEFLKSKNGNCADFSRLLVAVAGEKDLPVQMVSITFKAQDGAREEEEHLAVFNIGDKIYYLDLSNQVLRPYSGFFSTEDLIKDPRFQRSVLEDYQKAVKDGRSYTIAEEPKIISGEGAYHATYLMDMGHYYLHAAEIKIKSRPEQDFKPDALKAVHYLEGARKYLPDSYRINGEFGVANALIGKYDLAIGLLEDVLRKRSNPGFYDCLSNIHLHLANANMKAGKFDDAIQEIKIVLSDPNLSQGNATAKHILGRAYHKKAFSLPEDQVDKKIEMLNTAISQYQEAFRLYSPNDRSFEILKTDLAKAYHDLIGAYIPLGRLDDARKILETALREADEKGLPKKVFSDIEQYFKNK